MHIALLCAFARSAAGGFHSLICQLLMVLFAYNLRHSIDCLRLTRCRIPGIKRIISLIGTWHKTVVQFPVLTLTDKNWNIIVIFIILILSSSPLIFVDIQYWARIWPDFVENVYFPTVDLLVLGVIGTPRSRAKCNWVIYINFPQTWISVIWKGPMLMASVLNAVRCRCKGD